MFTAVKSVTSFPYYRKADVSILIISFSESGEEIQDKAKFTDFTHD